MWRASAIVGLLFLCGCGGSSKSLNPATDGITFSIKYSWTYSAFGPDTPQQGAPCNAASHGAAQTGVPVAIFDGNTHQFLASNTISADGTMTGDYCVVAKQVTAKGLRQHQSYSFSLGKQQFTANYSDLAGSNNWTIAWDANAQPLQ